MWSALRELFVGVPPNQRIWLALAIGCLLLAALGILVYCNLDLGPFWALLGGQ